MVLDLNGPQPAVNSEPVVELIQDQSGQVEWPTGCALVPVLVNPASAHNEAGTSTYTCPREFRTNGLSNVMAVTIIGDFEALLSVGIGLQHAADVKTFTHASPTRVVIDVPH